jgi:hypothetical protein
MLIITFFIVVVAIQLSYYLGVFGKFAFAKPKTTAKTLSISVIVCAKNEEKMLLTSSRCLLNKTILILKLS